MDGDKDEVHAEQVDLFGPAPDGRVASTDDLRVKESVEGVHPGEPLFFSSLNQQVHIKVDDLKKS